MTATAVVPTTTLASSPERRISPRMRHAIDLLVSGECRTQKDAAARVGLSRERLCRALQQEHIRVFYERRVRDSIAQGVMRASARVIELIHAHSEHVSLDAATHVLAIAGIKPASEPRLNVNIELKAGYVIDLTPHSDSPQAIEALPLLRGVPSLEITHDFGRRARARVSHAPFSRNSSGGSLDNFFPQKGGGKC